MRFRRELQALAVAVVLLVVADLAVSELGTRLTVDAQHVEAIPRLLAPLEGEGAPSVLFVGNSITRRGIDLELFERLAPGPGGVRVAAVHPDDTTIADWPFLYDRFVSSRGIAADVVVVPFATGQLRDDRPLNASRIGRDYTSFGELRPRLEELEGLSGRLELLGAYTSATYANRERLSVRLLDLIPNYRDLVQSINDAAVDARDAELEGVAPSYDRLIALSETVSATGGRLVIVAMPTLFDYELDENLFEAARVSGVEVVDLRDLAVDADGFVDELHLSRAGAIVATTAISDAVWEAG